MGSWEGSTSCLETPSLLASPSLLWGPASRGWQALPREFLKDTSCLLHFHEWKSLEYCWEGLLDVAAFLRSGHAWAHQVQGGASLKVALCGWGFSKRIKDSWVSHFGDDSGKWKLNLEVLGSVHLGLGLDCGLDKGAGDTATESLWFASWHWLNLCTEARLIWILRKLCDYRGLGFPRWVRSLVPNLNVSCSALFMGLLPKFSSKPQRQSQRSNGKCMLAYQGFMSTMLCAKYFQ